MNHTRQSYKSVARSHSMSEGHGDCCNQLPAGTDTEQHKTG